MTKQNAGGINNFEKKSQNLENILNKCHFSKKSTPMPICYYCFEYTDLGVQNNHQLYTDHCYVQAMCHDCFDRDNDQFTQWGQTQAKGDQLIPVVFHTRTKTWEIDKVALHQCATRQQQQQHQVKASAMS